MYSASTASSSTAAASAEAATRPATHQSAPGRPADAYAREPGSCCVAAHQDLVRRARQADGCLDVAVSADTLDPRRINDYERWDSWDALEAWRAVANPDTGIQIDATKVKAYEVSTERDPF